MNDVTLHNMGKAYIPHLLVVACLGLWFGEVGTEQRTRQTTQTIKYMPGTCGERESQHKQSMPRNEATVEPACFKVASGHRRCLDGTGDSRPAGCVNNLKTTKSQLEPVDLHISKTNDFLSLGLGTSAMVKRTTRPRRH